MSLQDDEISAQRTETSTIGSTHSLERSDQSLSKNKCPFERQTRCVVLCVVGGRVRTRPHQKKTHSFAVLLRKPVFTQLAHIHALFSVTKHDGYTAFVYQPALLCAAGFLGERLSIIIEPNLTVQHDNNGYISKPRNPETTPIEY